MRRSDVLSAWQGWRPLASDPHAPPGAPASRDHIVSTNPSTGITFVTGGKWTTYREMAEDAVDRVVELGGDAFGACCCVCFLFFVASCCAAVPRCVSDSHSHRSARLPHPAAHATPCVTPTTKLLGAEGYDENLPIQLVQSYGIATDAAAHLSKAYGGRAHSVCARTAPTGEAWPKYGVPLAPGYPYLESEVEQAVIEYARTVKDVVSLRTRLSYVARLAASSACALRPLARTHVAHNRSPRARSLARSFAPSQIPERSCRGGRRAARRRADGATTRVERSGASGPAR